MNISVLLSLFLSVNAWAKPTVPVNTPVFELKIGLIEGHQTESVTLQTRKDKKLVQHLMRIESNDGRRVSLMPERAFDAWLQRFNSTLPVKSWGKISTLGPCAKLVVIQSSKFQKGDRRRLCLDIANARTRAEFDKWWQDSKILAGAKI